MATNALRSLHTRKVKSLSIQRREKQPALSKDSTKLETIEESVNINGGPETEKIESEDVEPEVECCVIEIEKEIKKKLDEVPSPQGSHYSIFKVPSSIRNLKPDAFIPHVVSIGPFHRDTKLEMEEHKWRLLRHVLDITKCPQPEGTNCLEGTKCAHVLHSFTEAMYDVEEQTRKCYDKRRFKEINKQKFVKMMLLDSCFILEWLIVAADGITTRGYTSNDPLFTSWGISRFIQRDLLMLENQLPFFVLNKLLPLIKGQNIKDDSVGELALKFFDSVLPGLSPEYKGIKEPRHILDLVRQALHPAASQAKQPGLHLLEVVHHNVLFSSFRCTSFQDNCKDKRHLLDQKQPFQTTIPSVTSLLHSSVEFKKQGATKFTNIVFNERKGVLYIPRLAINDFTKSIFLNLMVFEQYYPQCSNYVTSYITFMDGLINSAKDVEYLCEKGIIEHDLGSDKEVAILFNNLRQDIVFHNNDYYLAKVSQDLNKHFNKKWHIRKGILKHEYLKDPWKVISIIAATFLIFFTLAQTTYTILGYHRPPS